MTQLSAEQQAVAFDSPMVPLSVVACAGSGKTSTATHRLAELRRQLGGGRGYIALLSFSNTAVQAFRDDYSTLSRQQEGDGRRRVVMETFDSFFTTHVLRPHAHRTMACSRSPFLLTGRESFLANQQFRFWVELEPGRRRPVEVNEVRASMVDGAPQLHWSPWGASAAIPITNGLAAMKSLGAVGAYTHDLGRYWVYRTLLEQPLVLRALVRRFPSVLVDEAQDIGTVHWAILSLLMAEGTQVSLIGDPHQAIYEFAGADGSVLRNYSTFEGAKPFALTVNFRSVPAIVAVANAVAQRQDSADRAAPPNRNGAFLVPFEKNNVMRMIEDFQSAARGSGLALDRSAVVCRGRALVERLRGAETEHGQGLVRRFGVAAVLRDLHADYAGAFETVVSCFSALLDGNSSVIVLKVLNPGRYPEVKALRRVVWRFVRDSEVGLPSSSLVADKVWHPALVSRVKCLLNELQSTFALKAGDNLGSRLAKTKLPSAPLAVPRPACGEGATRMRIDTVHQVKGESLDAVLYVADKRQALALSRGVGNEDGRIGYVALTRARDLFWLGVPFDSFPALKDSFLALGFQEWPVSGKE